VPAADTIRDAMSVYAVARRPSPGERVGPVSARLSSELMVEGLSGAGRTASRIVGPGGASVLCFVEPSTCEPQRTDAAIHLGRLLWCQVQAKPGDMLSVTPVLLAAAGAVSIVSPTLLSRAQERDMAAALHRIQPAVWAGARLLAPGTGRTDEGIVVRVRQVDPPSAYVGPETDITFEERDTLSAADPIGQSDVGGLDDVTARLREALIRPLTSPGSYRQLGIAPTRGVLLHGPPGTGKTLIGRVVAAGLREHGVSLHMKAATQLIGSYSGETEANLRAMFSDALQHTPSLIVLDEVDVLCADRSDLASQSDVRATSQLLSLLDGLNRIDGVVVLGTTNRLHVIDSAFRRPGRFDVEVSVSTPDPAARREILRIHTRDMPLTHAAESLLEARVESHTAGFTGADLMGLSREIGLAAFRRIEDVGRERGDPTPEAPIVSVEASDVEAGMARVTPSLLRRQQVPNLARDWDGIACLHGARQQLSAAAEHVRDGIAQEGLTLVGPSGNGKTLLVRALAKQFHLPLIEISPAALFTQWLGRSEGAVNEMFALALGSAPSILVIEQMDAIVPPPSRGARERVDDRVHAALASAIDDAIAHRGVLLIGVTDDLERVAPSIVRRGRLGLRIHVTHPPALRRRQIIEQALSEVGRWPVDSQSLDSMVDASDGWAAAAVDSWARDPALCSEVVQHG
jgi:transitional endoplasmic reticulum ATPase